MPRGKSAAPKRLVPPPSARLEPCEPLLPCLARLDAREPRTPTTSACLLLDLAADDVMMRILEHLWRAADLIALERTCSCFWKGASTERRAKQLALAHVRDWWSLDAEAGEGLGPGRWTSRLRYVEKVVLGRAATIAAGHRHALMLQRWVPPARAGVDERALVPARTGARSAEVGCADELCGEWRESFYGSVLSLVLGVAAQPSGRPTLMGTYHDGRGHLEGSVSVDAAGRICLEGSWLEVALEAAADSGSGGGGAAAGGGVDGADGANADVGSAVDTMLGSAGRGHFALCLEPGPGGGALGTRLVGRARAGHGWEGSWQAVRVGVHCDVLTTELARELSPSLAASPTAPSAASPLKHGYPRADCLALGHADGGGWDDGGGGGRGHGGSRLLAAGCDMHGELTGYVCAQRVSGTAPAGFFLPRRPLPAWPWPSRARTTALGGAATRPADKIDVVGAWPRRESDADVTCVVASGLNSAWVLASGRAVQWGADLTNRNAPGVLANRGPPCYLPLSARVTRLALTPNFVLACTAEARGNLWLCTARGGPWPMGAYLERELRRMAPWTHAPSAAVTDDAPAVEASGAPATAEAGGGDAADSRAASAPGPARQACPDVGTGTFVDVAARRDTALVLTRGGDVLELRQRPLHEVTDGVWRANTPVAFAEAASAAAARGGTDDAAAAVFAMCRRAPSLPCGMRAVSVGTLHAVALSCSGELYTWGGNTHGQCGPEITADHVARAHRVGREWFADLRVVAVAAGGFHTVALDERGRVVTFGDNDCGQLGHTALIGRPCHLEGCDPEIVEIAAGTAFTLAKARSGAVWSWGENVSGQLGRQASPDAPPASAMGTSTQVGGWCGPGQPGAVRLFRAAVVGSLTSHTAVAAGDDESR